MTRKLILLMATVLPLAAIALLFNVQARAGAATAATCLVPDQYGTIQAAVDQPDCATVAVGAGTFQENVSITRPVHIYGQGAGLTIVDGASAGSVFDIGQGAAVTLAEMTIRNGMATCGGGISNEGTTLLRHAAITTNTASTGGGICNHNGGVITVTHSSLTNNSATNLGGGIANANPLIDDTIDFGRVAVFYSTIRGNVAGSGSGGGIGSVIAPGEVEVWNSLVVDNEASGAGGGISAENRLTIVNSTIDGNTAQNGGGVHVASSQPLTVTSSTIANNSASGAGGGIRALFETVYLANTIIAGNTPSNCAGFMADFTSRGYNLSDTDECNLTAGGDLPLTDPLLGPLQDNYGPTLTRALLSGSPAMDAGNPAAPDSEAGACPAEDQRGRFRPVDGTGDGAARCDIGAYEYRELAIVKEGPAFVAPGAIFTYTLTVENELPLTLTNLLVTDVLPAGATYISGGVLAGDVVSWTYDVLAPGDTITSTFSVTTTATITNADYRVTSAENYSYTGTVAVVTVPQEPPPPSEEVALYLPVLRKPPPQPCPADFVPQLLAPEEGAVMDNGRSDGTDGIEWVFDWEPCAEAQIYQITIVRTGETPIVDDPLSEPSYTWSCDCYIPNDYLLGWMWRVRAWVDGAYGPWSEWRHFEVEPADSD